MSDPLDFYGYENLEKQARYRKKNRLKRIEKWRNLQERPTDKLLKYVSTLVERMVVGMPAMG